MTPKQRPVFKKGDRVKFVATPPGFLAFDTVSCGYIVAVTEDGYTVRIKGTTGGDFHRIPESCLVRWDDA
jgi:hypothetical protein